MPGRKNSVINLDVFQKEASRSHALMDADPVGAIEEARALSSDAPVKGVSYAGLKASILVDAGGAAKDESAIKEGVGLFRKLLKELPDNAQILYNLGNGLIALAAQKPYTGNNWYLETAAIRREARSRLKKALSPKTTNRLFLKHSQILATPCLPPIAGWRLTTPIECSQARPLECRRIDGRC